MKRVLAVVFLFAMQSFNAVSQQRTPANAHLDVFGTGWECNRGFAQRGEVCVPIQIPPNATLDLFGHAWECQRAYVQVGDACAPVRIPANAHLDVFGHAWECDANYKPQVGGCTLASPQEIQETQRLYRELAQKMAAQRRALDSVDWSTCNDELDRLRRGARDAADKASEVESAKSEYEACRSDRGTDCSSKRSQYDSEAQDFANELDAVMSRYKSALSSCGNR